MTISAVKVIGASVNFSKHTRKLKKIIGKSGKKTISPEGNYSLKNISVDIKAGDRVGLIGANGAGKTTFLRMIAGVYPPLKGEVEVNGSIISLFDLKAGMVMASTGFENIKLLAALRGYKLDNLDALREDVIDFTELGEALSRPVGTYSNGMKLRLAFAVATAHKPDILLIDEVVGVGDRTFRKKSQKRIEKLFAKTGTLIAASHNNSFLKGYCERGLVFDKGEIVFDGPINEAVKFSEEKL